MYQLGHDYGFKTEQQVSLLTLEGWVVVPYTGYDKHVSLLQHGAYIGAAKLCSDKPRKQFYLLVSLELEVSDPTPEVQRRIVGVDVGLRWTSAIWRWPQTPRTTWPSLPAQRRVLERTTTLG